MSRTLQTPYSKQLCLDYDEKLVAHLSRVRGIEMRIQRVQLMDLNLAALQDLLCQAAVRGTIIFIIILTPEKFSIALKGHKG